MRRKLFLFTWIAVFVLAAADRVGVPLIEKYPEELLNKEILYEGRAVAIESSDDEKLSVEAEIYSADGKEIEGKPRILISCYEETVKPHELCNSRISFRCEARLADEGRNPGCFDYRKHLLSEGMTAVGYIDRFISIESSGSLAGRIQRKLTELKYGFADSLSDRTKGILMGVIFGDTSFLSDDIYEAFKNNGTAHVLAVSGLHVGILYQWIKKLMGKRQSVFSLTATGILLLTYCFLSSFSASALRAACMIMLSACGTYLDRRYDTLTAAAFTALIFMAFNPYVIFNTGFRMSFMAVCSIAFFAKRMPERLPGGVAMMLSANIGLAPYQIYAFNLFSLSSFIANIPVVYLAGLTVPLGLLDFLTYSLVGEVKALRLITDSLSGIMIEVNGALTFGGKGAADMTGPPFWILVTIYSLMFFLTSEQFEIMRLRKEKKKIAAVLCFFAAFSMSVKAASYEPITDSDLIFVDVGQGDCVHIRAGETDVLIDGGGKAGYSVGEKTLKPYLLKNGVREVDLALATHLHTDHFKGLKELDKEGMIRELKTRLTAGRKFKLSEEASIETLWPVSLEEDSMQDENENCSVFMVTLKGVRILVTGDLDEEGEREMIRFYSKRKGGKDKLKADILKIGHHGSRTSTSDELLAAARPGYAVIQTGKNNYGHPDPKIIEKCREKGIMVLRNDTHGAVGFSFKKGEIRHHVTIEG